MCAKLLVKKTLLSLAHVSYDWFEMRTGGNTCILQCSQLELDYEQFERTAGDDSTMNRLSTDYGKYRMCSEGMETKSAVRIECCEYQKTAACIWKEIKQGCQGDARQKVAKFVVCRQSLCSLHDSIFPKFPRFVCLRIYLRQFCK